MEDYTLIAQAVSKLFTNRYSTSFSLGITKLAKPLRPHIYAIYGFVRLADEIVDSFLEIDQSAFLDDFKRQTEEALRDHFSLNPILHSFQQTVHAFNIEKEQIDSFLKSMQMDLTKKTYGTVEEYKEYIYGSADVVGLMCLQVFCEGNDDLYQKLREPAMSLGSAFQKVNFLRDFADDSKTLGRIYFPELDLSTFNEAAKHAILANIEEDFKKALPGIQELPLGSRQGVFLAYRYFLALLQKISKTPAEQLSVRRVRISNWQKALLYPIKAPKQLK